MPSVSKTQPIMRRKSQAPEAIPLTDPQYYFSRELSWLEFNNRVLHEALDDRTPLIERLKFLAIFSSNLDEFFMVRIAALKEQVEAEVIKLSIDGKTAFEQCLTSISTLSRYFDQNWPTTGFISWIILT
jgi:polyphosphate kinase